MAQPTWLLPTPGGPKIRMVAPFSSQESPLAKAMSHDLKGKVSPFIYAAAIGMAFVQPLISLGLYVTVAAIWFIPDQRVERTLRGS